MSKQPKIPAYVSRPRLIEELDICDRTLDDWIARRGFPKPKKPGGQFARWKWSEVERYMDGGQGEAVAPDVQADQLEEISRRHAEYVAERKARVRRRPRS